MKRISFFLSASLLLLAACTESSGGGGGGGGTGTTSTTSTTSTTTSSGTGGGECGVTYFSLDCPCGPVLCQFSCDGCFEACDPTNACPPGYWCNYPDDKCGAGQAGVCQPIPLGGCQESWHPRTCTCGGGVMPSDCPVIAGVDVSADPALCSDGTFTCGNLECKKYLEYCETVLPGVEGEPTYACKTSKCKIPECEGLCIEGLPQGACQMGDDGQIRVTIALP